MVLKKLSLLILIFLIPVSNSFGQYLEPLGAGKTYGCEPGTKSVFKHNSDGTNSRLSKRRVNSILSRIGEDPSKAKLFKDLKACINGKLRFRNPCSVVGAGRSAKVGAQVINGRVCTGESGSVVKVTITAENGNSSNCTGVVVHPKVVLTSAHCFSKLGISYSYTGTVTLSSGSYSTPYANYYGYFTTTPTYDVGYLAFESALPAATVIPLIDKGDTGLKGEPAVIAGYGFAEDQNSGDLIAGYTRIKSSTQLAITTSFAGYPGESSTCVGDSGGPLLVWRNKRWKLLGLTSDGSDPNCGPKAELYFTYVREDDAEDMLADSACSPLGIGAPMGECPFQFKNLSN